MVEEPRQWDMFGAQKYKPPGVALLLSARLFLLQGGWPFCNQEEADAVG